MKLSTWATEQGLTYKTAWRLYKTGKLPLPATQLPTGTIIVAPPKTKAVPVVALYARVSSYDQREDLERQLSRLRDYAATQGYQVMKETKEIGSGMNGKRKILLKLLTTPEIDLIVVEHKDRLMRFGFEFVEAALGASARRIIVINREECKNDLVQDMVEVLTSFCARLYGRRSAKNRAKRALESIQQC